MSEPKWRIPSEESNLVQIDRRMLDLLCGLDHRDGPLGYLLESGFHVLYLWQSGDEPETLRVPAEDFPDAAETLYEHVCHTSEPGALVGISAPGDSLELKLIVWYRSHVVEGAIYEVPFRVPNAPDSGLDVAAIRVLAVSPLKVVS